MTLKVLDLSTVSTRILVDELTSRKNVQVANSDTDDGGITILLIEGAGVLPGAKQIEGKGEERYIKYQQYNYSK